MRRRRRMRRAWRLLPLLSPRHHCLASHAGVLLLSCRCCCAHCHSRGEQFVDALQDQARPLCYSTADSHARPQQELGFHYLKAPRRPQRAAVASAAVGEGTDLSERLFARLRTRPLPKALLRAPLPPTSPSVSPPPTSREDSSVVDVLRPLNPFPRPLHPPLLLLHLPRVLP